MSAPQDPPRRDATVEEGCRPVAVTRVEDACAREAPDRVAHEEPLEIRVEGRPLAVVMRTPGHDAELVTGFLLTERVVAGLEDLVSVRHCDEAPSPEAADNVVRVRLRAGLRVDLESLGRNLFASSSCGVCGKATLDHALATAPPLHDDPARFDARLLYELPERLRAAQRVFDATGGLHAAGLFDPQGRLRVAREDVGRHNAVDKVVGWAARRGLPLSGHVLMVSGRISYEIVQKALAARCPLVAAVSAPTSLAVSLAREGGVGLVGFLRGRGLNVYGDRERVVGW